LATRQVAAGLCPRPCSAVCTRPRDFPYQRAGRKHAVSDPMEAPALVILAAGLGSRYGDAKQIAGVGPGGEWLLEYAIHDAIAAGFAQIVMVTRAPLREILLQRLTPHLRNRTALHFVEQRFEMVPEGCKVPAGRIKPLGTGHALCLLADHFSRNAHPAMVGYRLDATLSSHGGVNRGVCRVDEEGRLQTIQEFTNIGARGNELAGNAPDGTRTQLASDDVVSLNCWGLLPDLVPGLEHGLRAYLTTAGDTDEYLLPHSIAAHLAARGEMLSVLPTRDNWLGLTYPEDRDPVVAAIAELHAAAAYPTPLWSGA